MPRQMRQSYLPLTRTGLIAAILVSAIVLIIYLTDDTIKTAEDVEKYLGLSTLGLIPLAEEAGGRKKKKQS